MGCGVRGGELTAEALDRPRAGRLRPLAVPAATTALMLAVLIGLGAWQVHRLHWKTGILDQIDAAEAAPPVPLAPSLPPFAKVAVSGVWGQGAALYGSEVRDGGHGPVLGGQLIVPLLRPGAASMMVDLGWVPEATAVAPSGRAAVAGYLRPAEHAGWLSAPDDILKRRFFTLDPTAIGRALGLTNAAPFTLVVLAPPGAVPIPGAPQPATALPRPPNDHLMYAATWFGLAAVLVVFFVLYARKALAR